MQNLRTFLTASAGSTAPYFLISDFFTFSRNFYDDIFSIFIVILSGFISTILASLWRTFRRSIANRKAQEKYKPASKQRPFR